MIPVVRVDGSRVIHHLACFVVVVKGQTHEVNILRERLARALAKHKDVQQRRERENERP
jgi:hypothetical protein